MTITANVGVPGTGKTLHAVGQDIVAALKKRRLVVTNVPLNLPALSAFVGFEVDRHVVILEEIELGHVPFSDVADFEKYETWRSEGDSGTGPLYVVDECHEALADCNGLKGADHPLTLWFAKHRHKGTDVLLITQDRVEIPAPVRRRVEFTYQFRKLTAFGLSSRFVKLTFVGKGSDAVAKEFGKYPREWFGLYKSHGKGVAEMLPRQKNVLFNGKTYFIAASIAVALLVVFSNGLHLPGFGAAKPTAAKNAVQDPAHDSGKPVGADLAGKISSEVHTPEVDALRAKVEQVKLNAEYQMYANARVPKYGTLIPGAAGALGSDGGSALTWLPEKRPDSWRFDHTKARISGYVDVGNDRSYYVEFRRDGGGRPEVLRGDVVAAEAGGKFQGVSPCIAWLSGPHGSYKLTCDDFSEIGGDYVQVEEAAAAAPSEVITAPTWQAPTLKPVASVDRR